MVGRFDPSLDRAIAYAVAEGFVSLTNGKRVKLQAAGRELADAILHDETLMLEEKQLLREVGTTINDKTASRLMKGEYTSD